MSAAAARQHRSRLILCLAIVYLVWGSSYLATRIGVQQLPPILFGGVRFAIGGLVLGAFLWRRGFLAAARQDLRAILVMGLSGVAICNGFNAWGMQWVPSNESALLNASNALIIAVLGIFGPRAHPLRGRALAGLVIGLVGTALLLWPDGAASSPRIAQASVLTACVVWSLSTWYLRNTSTRLDTIAFTAVQMLFGGVAMILYGLAIGEAPRWHWNAAGMGSLVYLIVMSACIAYPAYAWLTRHATPAQVGSYAYVNPAIATLLGWLVLDERLGSVQLLGTVAILGGVLLVNWPRRGDPAAI